MTYKNKDCLRCGLEYSPTGKNQKYCAPCGLINKKEYSKKDYENNKEKKKEGGKKWREEHSNYMKEYFKKYYEENKDKWKLTPKQKEEKRKYNKEHRKEYCENNKEKIKKGRKKSYEKNKEREKERSKKNLHKKYKISHEEYSKITKECFICMIDKSISCHHLIFKKNGGKNKLENYIGLCYNCHHFVHSGMSINEIKEYYKKIGISPRTEQK